MMKDRRRLEAVPANDMLAPQPTSHCGAANAESPVQLTQDLQVTSATILLLTLLPLYSYYHFSLI